MCSIHTPCVFVYFLLRLCYVGSYLAYHILPIKKKKKTWHIIFYPMFVSMEHSPAFETYKVDTPIMLMHFLKAVRKDNKQRFGLLEENGELLIRANQGHSVLVIHPPLLNQICSFIWFKVCLLEIV